MPGGGFKISVHSGASVVESADMEPESTLTSGIKRLPSPDSRADFPPLSAEESAAWIAEVMAPDPAPTPGRGPSPLSLAEFKGCGPLLAVFAVGLIFAGWMKQRENEREIAELSSALNSQRRELLARQSSIKDEILTKLTRSIDGEKLTFELAQLAIQRQRSENEHLKFLAGRLPNGLGADISDDLEQNLEELGRLKNDVNTLHKDFATLDEDLRWLLKGLDN